MLRRDIGLTLAGGGNRAFYSMGLLNRWGPELLPRVAAISGSSAGVCVAVLALSGRHQHAEAYWRERRRGMTKNISLSRAVSGGALAPHGEIYGDTMRFALGEGGLERIQELPFPLLVLTSRKPRLLPSPLAAPVGFGLYSLEKWRNPKRVHATWTRRLGFAPMVYDARECATREALAALVLASSATPPFTPTGSVDGQRLLDGGLVDNAPTHLVDALPRVRKSLTMLTRPKASGPANDRRVYISPDTPPPVTRWDYTRPDLIAETIRLGEREADRKRGVLDKLLAQDQAIG